MSLAVSQSRSQRPRCFVNLNGQRGSPSLTKRIAASGNEIGSVAGSSVLVVLTLVKQVTYSSGLR